MNSHLKQKISFSKENFTRYNNINNFNNNNNHFQVTLSQGTTKEEKMQLVSRVDYAMANHEWTKLYSSTVIEHLHIIGSDHAPILVDTNTNKFYKFNNFRFEAKWLLEENVLDLAKSVILLY